MAVPFSTPVKMGCRAVGGEGAGAAAASCSGGFTSGACAHEIARLLSKERWVPRLRSGFRRRARTPAERLNIVPLKLSDFARFVAIKIRIENGSERIQ